MQKNTDTKKKGRLEMTLSELTREQLICLKQNILCRKLEEEGNRTPSYGELADADEIIPNSMVAEEYSDTIFSPDDFF